MTKSIADQIKQFEEEREILYSSVRKAANALNKKILELKNKQLQKYVGKYYKTQNHYSCPEKPEDYWSLYTYVTHAKDDSLYTITYQITQYNILQIEKEKFMYPALLDDYQEITKEEALEAFEEMKKFVNDIEKTLTGE